MMLTEVQTMPTTKMPTFCNADAQDETLTAILHAFSGDQEDDDIQKSTSKSVSFKDNKDKHRSSKETTGEPAWMSHQQPLTRRPTEDIPLVAITSIDMEEEPLDSVSIATVSSSSTSSHSDNDAGGESTKDATNAIEPNQKTKKSGSLLSRFRKASKPSRKPKKPEVVLSVKSKQNVVVTTRNQEKTQKARATFVNVQIIDARDDDNQDKDCGYIPAKITTEQWAAMANKAKTADAKTTLWLEKTIQKNAASILSDTGSKRILVAETTLVTPKEAAQGPVWFTLPKSQQFSAFLEQNPQFVDAPKGPPEILIMTSWDSLIANDAAKKVDTPKFVSTLMTSEELQQQKYAEERNGRDSPEGKSGVSKQQERPSPNAPVTSNNKTKATIVPKAGAAAGRPKKIASWRTSHKRVPNSIYKN